jgi:heme-degrading monooxygenase HmoA
VNQPALILLVKFKSPLSLAEVEKVAAGRLSEFRALSGLKQKYYLQDSQTGEFAGLYFWESQDALAEFRHSDLRASIAGAYQTEGEPRVEVFSVFEVLRESML